MSAAYNNELKIAAGLSIQQGFISRLSEFSVPAKLANRKTQIELSKAIGRAWPTHVEGGHRLPALGMCLTLVGRFLPVVKEQLGCDVWATFGWIYDTQKKQAVYYSETPELVTILQTILAISEPSSQHSIVLNCHVWITAETGEAIDATFYPALAELSPSRFSTGKQVYAQITTTGGLYHRVSELPIVEHHPQVLLDEAAIAKLVQYD